MKEKQGGVKLLKGMLIKTNYSGPYRILEIIRGCTCPSYSDMIEMDNPPERPPHIHLVCTRPDGSGKFWINDFCEETLMSLEKSYCGYKRVADYDRIIILEADKPIQMALF